MPKGEQGLRRARGRFCAVTGAVHVGSDVQAAELGGGHKSEWPTVQQSDFEMGISRCACEWFAQQMSD